MAVRSTDKTTKGIGISKVQRSKSTIFYSTQDTGGGTTFLGWNIDGIDVSSNTSTSIAEVQLIFNTNLSDAFSAGGGNNNPALVKSWRFTNGYPLNTGDVVTLFGSDGGGFCAGLSLTNGQNTSCYSPLTVTSPARFYQISAGSFGLSGQFGLINYFTVNGNVIYWPPTS